MPTARRTDRRGRPARRNRPAAAWLLAALWLAVSPATAQQSRDGHGNDPPQSGRPGTVRPNAALSVPNPSSTTSSRAPGADPSVNRAASPQTSHAGATPPTPILSGPVSPNASRSGKRTIRDSQVRPAGLFAPSSADDGPAATAVESFEAVAAPEWPPADRGRTPIGRGSASETDPDGRPSAAATLKKGTWTSGMVVLLLALCGGVTVLTLRKRNPVLAGGLPDEVVAVLGRRRVDGRNSVGLLRVGRRMLVVAVGDGGIQTLCEIDDPVEVDALAGACRAGGGESFGQMLRGVLPGPNSRPAPSATAASANPTPATPTVPHATARAAATRSTAPQAQPRPRTPLRDAAQTVPAREMADLPGLRGRTRLDVTTP